jgi:hypothetical protein
MTGNIYFSKVISAKYVHPLCFWQYVLDLITFTSCVPGNMCLILPLLFIPWYSYLVPGTWLVNIIKSSTYCQEHNWWTWSNLPHITRNTTGDHDKIYHILPGTWLVKYVLDLIMFTNHVPGNMW